MNNFGLILRNIVSFLFPVPFLLSLAIEHGRVTRTIEPFHFTNKQSNKTSSGRRSNRSISSHGRRSAESSQTHSDAGNETDNH
jgi:hypothetical protein